MANVQHADLVAGSIHLVYNWSYANAAARTGASGFVSSDLGKLARQTDDNSLWMLTATTPTWVQIGSSSLGTGYIIIRDEKAQNTNGGTFTSGAWQTRNLNTEAVDTGNHATVASNQITLLAGTYRCSITAPALRVDSHQARLQDITNTATLLVGTSEYSNSSGYYSQAPSFIVGRFTLSGTTVIEVQHRCGTTQATNGWGVAFNQTTEVYTIAEFWRE